MSTTDANTDDILAILAGLAGLATLYAWMVWIEVGPAFFAFIIGTALVIISMGHAIARILETLEIEPP